MKPCGTSASKICSGGEVSCRDTLGTKRLRLSRLSYDDSQFIYNLLNEAGFKRFIGDRGINTLDDAREYLRKGPIGSYENHGYGLWLVRLRQGSIPVGICGLVKREALEFPDLGFAFREQYWANGYAHESSLATIDYARRELGLTHIIALVNGDNKSSIGLLQKLGFEFEKMARMPGEAFDICRYALDL